MLDESELRRVLVVTAHPDDVDFGAAGTVARWTSRGVRVTYCLVTSGEAGGFDRAVPRPAVAEVRRREQRRAAAHVDADDLVFLGYPDGRVEVTLDLRRDIARVVRRVRPQRVVTQSPTRDLDRIYASHPDHLAVGEATLDAVYPDARNPHAHPELLDEGLEPHVVRDVWLMAAPDADHAVDVTDTFDRKVAALLAHASQVGDPEALVDRVRAWAADAARRAGLGAGRLAEVFRVVDTG